LKLLDLVPTPLHSFDKTPLVALGSRGSRSRGKPGLPSFHSTCLTPRCRVILPSPAHGPSARPPMIRPVVVRREHDAGAGSTFVPSHGAKSLHPGGQRGTRPSRGRGGVCRQTRRQRGARLLHPLRVGGFLAAASFIPTTVTHRPCKGCPSCVMHIFARRYVKIPFLGSKGSWL